MDDKAIDIIYDYITKNLNQTDTDTNFKVYIVWKCKTLQNWKWMVSSTLADGMYYEVTYNGDKKEFYLDVYKKVENVCIK